ncbi:hypothetical protein G7Y29_01880 [Corynebacterium qintianiae]|uniref:Uncharacterized protein n=1 Tax=Corynebacterium qintianiae TaxID=2709392 RepID=A0A7T0KMQ3_9CORY|nr:hypothetical protein [Corynebacterium qintianiae]QPK83586.1 hypothetical protein G7Y29_01880 [Corynebacterium qintianiae]
MLKLNNANRRWIGLALALWLIALIAIIFLPMSRGGAQASHTDSLAQSLQQTQAANGDSVVAELVNPALVYNESFVGYTTMCPTDPAELTQAKMQAFQLDGAQVDMSGKYGYMVLLPAQQGEEVTLDRVNLDTVDICTVPQSESFPLNTPIPFYLDDGTWKMGINS